MNVHRSDATVKNVLIAVNDKLDFQLTFTLVIVLLGLRFQLVANQPLPMLYVVDSADVHLGLQVRMGRHESSLFKGFPWRDICFHYKSL